MAVILEEVLSKCPGCGRKTPVMFSAVLIIPLRLCRCAATSLSVSGHGWEGLHLLRRMEDVKALLGLPALVEFKPLHLFFVAQLALVVISPTWVAPSVNWHGRCCNRSSRMCGVVAALWLLSYCKSGNCSLIYSSRCRWRASNIIMGPADPEQKPHHHHHHLLTQAAMDNKAEVQNLSLKLMKSVNLFL